MTKRLGRDEEAILVICYKYFYRPIDTRQIAAEIDAYGLLDMSEDEFIAFAKSLSAERAALKEAIKNALFRAFPERFSLDDLDEDVDKLWKEMVYG